MDVDDLINELGYGSSPNFVRGDRMGDVVEHAHTFRSARATCNVEGVYLLQESGSSASGLSTPVVFVAKANSEAEADRIHRAVWNQNIVPFLIVWTPSTVRLYSGFRYSAPKKRTRRPPEARGLLEPALKFSDVRKGLSNLTADAIDDGTLWRERAAQITPEFRVDWKLLANLRTLGKTLHTKLGLASEVAHALIGKFVYLRYLHDRGILSPRKLEEWGLEHGAVFGRKAERRAVQALIEHVDEWLNGSIFPLRWTGPDAPTVDHLREVTGVFLGDDADKGQLHLDFQAYDFSFIPIETLSNIYEQFLHAKGEGKDNGAYYTPIPLVNFMVAELNDARPLEKKMRIFDPSCGSGAFLVHCYRRLVESQIRENGGQTPRPSELRDMLVRHIFGLDRDPQACQVAGLSLVMTMLDYIEPRDLTATPTFNLPHLRDTNICQGDFFDPDSSWRETIVVDGFDWIVGNPPWVQLNGKVLKAPAREYSALRRTRDDAEASADRKAAQAAIDKLKEEFPDVPAWCWMTTHASTHPVVANEVAEAFAWDVAPMLKDKGAISLLMPAMSLFREHIAFREGFFTKMAIRSVANFSNLRHVLFAGRAEMPAAAISYTPHALPSSDEPRAPVLVYSPMVANQEANRPVAEGEKQQTWSITLDRSEIRSVRHERICGGDPLPWKIAMWASSRDERLLVALGRRHGSLDAFLASKGLILSQGLKLRDGGSEEKKLPATEVIDKFELNIEALRGGGRIYSFPSSALKQIPANGAWVRKRSGIGPLKVCRPPHIAVSAARTFAVYCGDYLVIPDPHIGIAGKQGQENLLKAIALYLNSDFVAYQQFLASPQGGIRDGRSTLAALKKLPTPLDRLDQSEVEAWAALYDELVVAHRSVVKAEPRSDTRNLDGFDAHEAHDEFKRLGVSLNKRVGRALGLDEFQRWLVEDFVGVRMRLSDGQCPADVVRPPLEEEVSAYAEALARALDSHLKAENERRHRVVVAMDRDAGMALIELAASTQHPVRVLPLVSEDAGRVRMLYHSFKPRRGQWKYFERNILRFFGGQSLILKPLQRFWWTRSQALADADEIRAEKLSVTEAE